MKLLIQLLIMYLTSIFLKDILLKCLQLRRKQREARERLSDLEGKKRSLEELIRDCKSVDIVSSDEEVFILKILIFFFPKICFVNANN